MKKENHRRERASHILSCGGYKRGGAIPKEVKKAVHKHEEHDHPGKPLTKLKKGGNAGGEASKNRLDKPSRKNREHAGAKCLARGGKTSKGKKGTTVNVIIAGGKGDESPMPPPAAAAPMPPRPMPPRPPMAPPAAPPGAGAPPFKRGGAIKNNPKYPLDAGSGGGEGRIEKAAAYRKRHSGHKKRGGKC